MIENAASVGLVHYVIPQASVPKSFKKDSGLMILSRYPIVEEDFSLFKSNDLSTFARGI
jgi:hypothetical protein